MVEKGDRQTLDALYPGGIYLTMAAGDIACMQTNTCVTM